MDMEFSTYLFVAIVGAILAFASGIAPYFWTKFTENQRNTIVFWVEKAVELAEQTIIGEKAGAERYEFVETWLNDHGIKIPADKLKVYVESAVYNLKSRVSAVKS